MVQLKNGLGSEDDPEQAKVSVPISNTLWVSTQWWKQWIVAY